MCLLDGIQILALDVLNECHLRELRIRRCAKDDRDGGEPCEACCTQAALARDELVFPAADVAHGEGLEDAMPRDGLAQFLERCLIELTARLKAVRPNGLYGQRGRGACLCRWCRCFCRCCGRGGLCGFCRTRKGVFPQPERTKPASKAACLSLLHAS